MINSTGLVKRQQNLGYLKYNGEMVEEGYMDARKSAQALLGFDEAVRFFACHQAPDLKKTDFEFPVRVKKGSWEVVVPDLIELAKVSGGLIATAYGTKAAQKMAENDFKDVGLKDVFRKSLHAIQWVIKIGKHLGDLTIKKFNDVKFIDNNALIGIRNSEGEYLYVPKEFLDFYVAANPKLLAKMSELVEEERVLSIGVYTHGELIEESLTRKHRRIFTQEVEEQEEELFPELKHNAKVILEGELTRGNEMTNTMGFGYKGHILTCLPLYGSIVHFKPSLFLKCRIEGSISRRDEKGRLTAKKPKIIFTDIIPLEKESDTPSLFD